MARGWLDKAESSMRLVNPIYFHSQSDSEKFLICVLFSLRLSSETFLSKEET